MGSHFHDWIDYYGASFLKKLLEWGHTFSGFWGSENSGMYAFKDRKIYTTLNLTNVSVHFRMHKQKVSKLGLQKLLKDRVYMATE